MELPFLWLAAILALLGLVLGNTENTAYHLSQDQNHLLTPLDLHLPQNSEPHKRGLIKVKRKIIRRYKKRGSSQEDHENSSHLEQSESSGDKTEENVTKEQIIENLEEQTKHFATNNEESNVQTQNSIITIDPSHTLDKNSEEINEEISELPIETRRSFGPHSVESKDPNPYIHSVIYKSFGPTHNFEGDKELHQFLPVNNDQQFSAHHASFLESQNLSPTLKSLIHRSSVQTQHIPHKTEEHHVFIQKHSNLPSQAQKPTQTLAIHKVFHQNHHSLNSEGNDEFNVQLPFNSQKAFTQTQVLRHKTSQAQNPTQTLEIHKVFHQNHHLPHSSEGKDEFNVQLPLNNQKSFSQTQVFSTQSQAQNPTQTLEIHKVFHQNHHLPHSSEGNNEINVQLPFNSQSQSQSFSHSQVLRHKESPVQNPTQTLEIHKVFQQNHQLPHISEGKDEFTVQLPLNSQKGFSQTQVFSTQSQAQNPTQTVEIHKVFHQNHHLPHSSEDNDKFSVQLPFSSQGQSFSHSQVLRNKESQAQNPTQTLEIHKVFHQNHNLPYSSEGKDEFNVQLPLNGQKSFSQTQVFSTQSQAQTPTHTLEYYKKIDTKNQLPPITEGSDDVQVQMSSVSQVLPHSKENQEENQIQILEFPSKDENSDAVVDVYLPYEITFDESNQSPTLENQDLELNIISPVEFDKSFDTNEHSSKVTDSLQLYGFNKQPGSFDNLDCAALKFKLQMLFKSLYPYLDPRTPHPNPLALQQLLGLVQLYLNLSKYYDFGRMTQQQILYILYHYATNANSIQTAEGGLGQISVSSNSQVSIHNVHHPGRQGPDLPSIDASEINPKYLEGLITYFTQIGLLPDTNDGRLPQELLRKCKDVYSRRFLLRLKSAVSEYANSFEMCVNNLVGHSQLTQRLGDVVEYVVPDQVGFVTE